MPFDQGHDVSVVRARDQIPFPMTGNGPVVDLSGPLPDGDGVRYPTAWILTGSSVPRPAHAGVAPQVAQELLFQQSARLNEQAAVNSLVGHAHALIAGKPKL